MNLKDHNHGRVTDPLNVDWSRWKIPGFDQEAINLRIRRRVARSRMLRFRVVQVCRRVWFVTLSVIQVSEAEFSYRELAAGLTWTPQQFWCLSKRKAKSLIYRDHLAGGAGTMFPVEYRLCPNCSRVLLGAEATDYRTKQLRPVATWHFDDGPACSIECKPNGRGPNGQRIQYRKDQAA